MKAASVVTVCGPYVEHPRLGEYLWCQAVVPAWDSWTNPVDFLAAVLESMAASYVKRGGDLARAEWQAAPWSAPAKRTVTR